MKGICSKTVLIFLCFFVLSACRNESNTNQTTPTGQTTVPETVSIRLPAKAKNLNPYFAATSAIDGQIVGHMFPFLINYNPQTVELEAVLAKSLPSVIENEDGTVDYTYEIRSEARWDNGSPVTGEDYVFSLKALMNPKVAAAAYRGAMASIGIKEVKVDPQNPKKFTVKVAKKSVPAKEYTGGVYFYPSYIYDPNSLMKDISLQDLLDPEKAKDLAENNPKIQEFADSFNDTKHSREKEFISGCGPYQLEEWVSGERIVLVKKENWWGDNLDEKSSIYLKGMPKKIIYQPVPDSNAAISLVKNKSIDVATGISPPKSYEDLKNSAIGKENYHFFSPERPSFIAYFLNTRNPKLADKKVRRALAHMIDMDLAIKNFAYGLVKKINGPVLDYEPGFNKNLPSVDFNLVKARNLLAEAGWTDSNNNGTVDKQIDGSTVEMELNVSIQANRTLTENITLLFQENAKKAGVKINIDLKEFNILREDKQKRDFEIVIEGKGRQPFYNPTQSWHTKSDRPNGQNYTGFGNAETDALIEEIVGTIDDNKRNELYRQFQAKLYEEQPAIFLYTMTRPLVVHKKFVDVMTSSVRPGFFENSFVIEAEM